MTIQSVERAIDIVSLFSVERPRLGITEISASLDLSKTTVHGLVKTLVARGFLRQDTETRKYRLGLKIYELGVFLGGTLKINQVGVAPAHRLTERTGQMSMLAIWEKNTVLVTLGVTPELRGTSSQQMGIRLPGYATATGKAILAALPSDMLDEYLRDTVLEPRTPQTITRKKRLRKNLAEARANGYATDEGEYIKGLTCIGAAIYDRTGAPVASISVSGGPDFLTENLKETASEVMNTAAEISRAMGHMPEAFANNNLRS